jgi:hypothetical protein
MHGNVLENFLFELWSILRTFLGADRQVGWDCVIKCNWEYIGELAQQCASELLDSKFRSVWSRRLAEYNQVQLGASMRASPGVYLRMNSEV